MSLSEIFASDQLAISIELFPPKTSKGESNLYGHVEKLMKYSPDFITCTYGAGGSTRNKTLDIVKTVKERFGVPVASHLTVVESTVDDLRSYLTRATEQGVDYIVALRGDPPQGETEFKQTEGGFRYANQLVELIHSEFNHFGVAVAGYPEVHREAVSAETDLDNLKRKVDAGADVVVTQLFYDNQDFHRFRERCVAAGITVPIVPGILPVVSLRQIERIASLCGANLPPTFVSRLAEKDDADWQFQVGVEQAVQQTRDLIDNGADGLHFYVLNRSNATNTVLEAVDIASVRSVR